MFEVLLIHLDILPNVVVVGGALGVGDAVVGGAVVESTINISGTFIFVSKM